MNAEHKLADALKPLMKHHGWKKNRHGWHKDRDETILVLNIQKALFHERIYLNWGVYIKALGDENKPHESSCHVRGRFDDQIGVDNLDFNHNNEFQTTEQIKKIYGYVENNALDFLENLSTIHELRKYDRGTIGKQVKNFFLNYE